MKKTNDWYKDQERTKKHTFKPKWTKEIILSIIEDVRETVDFIDTQYKLVKAHSISLATAGLWIEMSRRVMKDMDNGLSIDKALERDKERRNQMRRKNT